MPGAARCPMDMEGSARNGRLRQDLHGTWSRKDLEGFWKDVEGFGKHWRDLGQILRDMEGFGWNRCDLDASVRIRRDVENVGRI